MSDNANPSGEPQEQAQEADAPQVFTAEYVEKLRKENAKHRTEAKANAEAAQRLAEIEDANKSETQRLSEALTAAERDRDSARTEALRLRIATKYGVSDEDADLFLTGSNEEALTKQAERLAARESDRKKNGNHVPREGTNPKSSGNNELNEFTRTLFRRND
ncbi:hypothetical protein [Prescottella agglutinans]|uniref:Scaffolding protein n=1 Tax=Prescottella agglutinans TaxID=1644129 RepID=A0ABT6M4W7_9NOCA|nr:hypothetical protein [Prescottella agglutinans]MDH6279349.1 hypothetical protein [Prescottella agglutinans]